MRLSPSGRWLALAHADGRVALWDLSTARQTNVLPASKAIVTDLAFDPAEQTLALRAPQDTRLFDLGKRKLHHRTSRRGKRHRVESRR